MMNKRAPFLKISFIFCILILLSGCVISGKKTYWLNDYSREVNYEYDLIERVKWELLPPKEQVELGEAYGNIIFEYPRSVLLYTDNTNIVEFGFKENGTVVWRNYQEPIFK